MKRLEDGQGFVLAMGTWRDIKGYKNRIFKDLDRLPDQEIFVTNVLVNKQEFLYSAYKQSGA